MKTSEKNRSDFQGGNSFHNEHRMKNCFFKKIIVLLYYLLQTVFIKTPKNGRSCSPVTPTFLTLQMLNGEEYVNEFKGWSEILTLQDNYKNFICIVVILYSNDGLNK